MYQILFYTWLRTITKRPFGVVSTRLAELHCILLALALLELVVQERAGLLVSPVHLETLKKHLFVRSTGTLKNLLLLLLLHHVISSNLRGLHSFTASSSHGTCSSSDRSVGNRGTSSESHTLGNGG